jgi:hypothetical protein
MEETEVEVVELEHPVKNFLRGIYNVTPKKVVNGIGTGISAPFRYINSKLNHKPIDSDIDSESTNLKEDDLDSIFDKFMEMFAKLSDEARLEVIKKLTKCNEFLTGLDNYKMTIKGLGKHYSNKTEDEQDNQHQDV